MTELAEVKNYGTSLAMVPEILSFLEDFLKKAGLVEFSLEVQLAVEEWYVNILKHGFGGEEGGEVELDIRFSFGVLKIVISDNGPAFDPHSIPEPEKPGSVEDAKIGGLGIHFIRKIMDRTAYRREGNRNVFTMRRFLQ